MATSRPCAGPTSSCSRLREVDAANATLAERTRLAREIHDGLAQDLWYAKLKQGRLTQNESLDAEAKTTAGEVLNAIDSALAEARQAVMAMRVDPSAASSLEEVLRSYVEDFADRFGVRAEFEAEGTLQRLPPRTEAEVLRIVQEALNNVRRHADATRRPGPDRADRADLAHLGHRQWTRVRPVRRAAGELRPARDARTGRAGRRDAGHPVAPRRTGRGSPSKSRPRRQRARETDPAGHARRRPRLRALGDPPGADRAGRRGRRRGTDRRGGAPDRARAPAGRHADRHRPAGDERPAPPARARARACRIRSS